MAKVRAIFSAVDNKIEEKICVKHVIFELWR